jgi:hypothetical protein
MKNVEPIFQLEKNINNVNTIVHFVKETELKELYNNFVNNYQGTVNSVENFSKDTQLTIESIGYIIGKYRN